MVGSFISFQFFEEHESVPDSRKKQTEPIDLDTCLQAFTKEEEMGEDDLYYCSKCKKHCLASKKLDIWRLPPVLVRIYIAPDKRGIHIIFFLFLDEYICCGYSLEVPHRGASNEYPQHMFSLRNKNVISIFRMKKAPYLLL